MMLENFKCWFYRKVGNILLLFEDYYYSPIFVILLVIAMGTAQAREEFYDYVAVTKVGYIYDADTYRFTVSGWPPIISDDMAFRLRGVDAPEIRGKCVSEKQLAIKGRDFVRSVLSSSSVRLRDWGRGAFFRIIVKVEYYYDGNWVDLGTELVRRKLARLYSVKDGRMGWC